MKLTLSYYLIHLGKEVCLVMLIIFNDIALVGSYISHGLKLVTLSLSCPNLFLVYHRLQLFTF